MIPEEYRESREVHIGDRHITVGRGMVAIDDGNGIPRVFDLSTFDVIEAPDFDPHGDRPYEHVALADDYQVGHGMQSPAVVSELPVQLREYIEERSDREYAFACNSAATPADILELAGVDTYPINSTAHV